MRPGRSLGGRWSNPPTGGGCWRILATSCAPRPHGTKGSHLRRMVSTVEVLRRTRRHMASPGGINLDHSTLKQRSTVESSPSRRVLHEHTASLHQWATSSFCGGTAPPRPPPLLVAPPVLSPGPKPPPVPTAPPPVRTMAPSPPRRNTFPETGDGGKYDTLDLCVQCGYLSGECLHISP